jgi:hypothetical protein
MINKVMKPSDKIDEFMDLFAESLQGGSFIKATLGHYKGNDPELKNIAIRKTIIKKMEKLSFTFRYKTNDIVKNFDFEEGWNIVGDCLDNGFLSATLYTTDYDLQLETGKKGAFLKKSAATQAVEQNLSHDRAKNRFVETTRPYLNALGITDEKGNVHKNSQDKYKQINRYIGILDVMIKSLPTDKKVHIADMGSGKGYLTFALYDYMTHSMGRDVVVTGVEYRQDMVDLCNKLARNSAFDGLSFEQGTIADYKTDYLDVLIALHACDTATDDAIAKGIHADADLIIVAPCCHKQIRREMESGARDNDLSAITKHGIFMERQAEMTTDAMRALYLESEGYSTKVFEFISGEHTPKNVMISAEKSKKSDAQKKEAIAQIDATKSFFGIKTHYLETALGR